MVSYKHDSNFMISKVKPESIDFAIATPQSSYGYSYVDIDDRNSESGDIMKKEEYAFVLVREIKLDTTDVTENISNTGTACNDIEMKLDFSDDNDLLNFSCGNDIPYKEEDKSEGDYKPMMHMQKICKNSFSRSSDLKKHIKTCTELKHCSMNDIYTNSCKMNNSILKQVAVHKNERYKCKICCMHFKTRKFILKHMQLHQNKTFRGAENSTTTYRRNVTNHIKMYLSARNYKCEVCTKYFTTKQNLSNHMKIHMGEKKYKCEICTKYVTTKHNLSNHMKIHTGERKYKCEICTKRFIAKWNLTNHMKIHPGERNYKCEICTKCFTTERNLSNHMKIHTGKNRYKCEICTKCVTTKHSLSNHMKVHSGERNYKCEICNKYFKVKEHLSTHMKIHTGKRTYKCEICTKCVTSKQSLSNHMNTHTGKRNYKCEVCSKCVTSKQSLLNHMKMHTGERNYKCEICEKSFVAKWNLANHMKIHPDERNYKCDICTKSFKTKEHLSSHMKVHTGEKRYECEICTNCFRTKQNLSKHMKVHTLKKNVFIENKKTYIEEKLVRKFVRAQNVGAIEKGLIKEETDVIVKEEKVEIDSDAIKRKSTMEQKLNSTETFDLWQTFNSEIIIKEEGNIIAAT